jgi:Thymidylate kinase
MAERMSVGAVSGDPSPPGFLVTLDGPSGTGKTTVSALVAEQLSRSAHPVWHTTQPSRSPLGEIARQGTYHYRGLALSCLVAADRYDHLAREIEPALAAGLIVVCDRYAPSALVLDRLDGLSHWLMPAGGPGCRGRQSSRRSQPRNSNSSSSRQAGPIIHS